MLDKTQLRNIKYEVGSKEDSNLPVIFSTLGDPTRYRIFRLLMMRNEDICVSEIADIFNLSVPAVSHQLKILEMVGLIRKHRIGKTICYKVRRDAEAVKAVSKVIIKSR